MSNNSRVRPIAIIRDGYPSDNVELNRRDALKLSLDILALGAGIRPEELKANPTVMVWATTTIALTSLGTFFSKFGTGFSMRTIMAPC